MNINDKLIWDNTDWNEINLFINKIQSRIVKASLNKNWKLIKDLQRLLVNSYYAKLLAVKRVTSNKGKKTPGVDNVIIRTSKEKYELAMSLNKGKYKPMPLRRTHIKKKNGKLRPLGIPTMHDRAMQALYLMALEPVVETLSDKTSFGFRKGRSCADAREQLFINYSRKTAPMWILEGDIKGCFDNISHDWLIENVPMDKSILRSFLKAGFIHNGFRFSTDNGTPQGGIISPCLSNFTLDGIDKLLKDNFKRHKNEGKKRTKVHLIRYADDFIITAGTKEIAIKAKALVKEFLA
ncbi:MAG: reverse transcriptase domain-containing protein, partial [Clostridium sp.]